MALDPLVEGVLRDFSNRVFGDLKINGGRLWALSREKESAVNRASAARAAKFR